ncbi:thiamine pyrophosphate enzyme, N-terminal TPP binding domain-containing protein [Mycena floridula]|nr:thiamine pyrophosphate enzyme, N-terminal TPP binding domain-containing protein [Mycena floridula]
MLTTASVFLKSLKDVGITHVFVNWGSDHPALLEELERQRSQEGETMPARVITAPNEMVALSAAQGFAQVSGKPAAVIVHVDVGTQALAGAIHNVDRGRTPVLIYAGASPFSDEKEHHGGRNEWIMWMQDIPDQSAIVRQYMRFTAQLNSPETTSKVVQRSLQIAMSEPKGPVYLWARRETMEQQIDENVYRDLSVSSHWPAVEPMALSPSAAKRIASALGSATSPLILTSYLGRNIKAIEPLVALSTLLAISIVVTCPSAVNVPASHPYFAGITYLQRGGHSPLLSQADVILVIDCELPWIPGNEKPSSGARVFILDGGDPLKLNIGYWHIDAEMIAQADSEVALGQILKALDGSNVSEAKVSDRAVKLTKTHLDYHRGLDDLENDFESHSTLTVPNIVGVLRKAMEGTKTLVLSEAISNYGIVWTHLRPEIPGTVLSSGGSALGWGIAAAVGASLGNPGQFDLISLVIGDGTFLFAVPASAFWMARKYNTPFLTIVLNNGGWRSPKLSMLGVHPTGHGSQVSGERLSVGFGPDCPDFAQIAVAATAGWAWGKRVSLADGGKTGFESVVTEAIRIVLEERRCAVIECMLEWI